jgi:DNA polymerase elongation subunit (family B)
MPLNFDTEVEKMGAVSNSISKMPSERALLNLFFARLKQLDPDVIIVCICL